MGEAPAKRARRRHAAVSLVSGRARILILSSAPLCRNPRVLKEARTLAAADHAVTVLTVASRPEFEALDRALLANERFAKIAVRRSFVSRASTWLARHTATRGIESPQAFGPAAQLRKQAVAFPADLIIAHTELAFCVAADLAARGRRVAVDFEDWHSEDLSPAAQPLRPRRLLRRVEIELLRRSAYATTTSAALSAALAEYAGSKAPAVITNSFPLESPVAHLNANQPPAFFWFSQTIGPDRGLEAFLDAWVLTLAPSRVRLLGDISRHYAEQLRRRVPVARQSQLEFLPLVSPDELPKIIAEQDIGLALENQLPRSRDLTITNKILQYLNAGLPVIATGTTGQREVLSRAPEAGQIVDFGQPRNAAAQLDELARNAERRMRMGVAARRAAEMIYSWEREAPKLLALVAAALHER